MELTEELELPPWEKFRLYGKFPWKLCLHFTLVALVTALVITINLSYAAYSRSVWLTIANVMYPPNYSRYQSDLSSPFQYYIYTQTQTIYDGNRLFQQYYLLANESVNEVNVFSMSNNEYNVAVPRVVIHSTTGVSTFLVEDPLAADSWPLAYSANSSTNLRQFFNNLKKMDFHFYFRSNSNGAGYNIDGSTCFFWHWHISYSSYGAGQIMVDADAFIQSSCSTLSRYSTTFLLAVAIFVISLWYQLLLLKAIARQVIVISQLSDPLFWTRWQHELPEQQLHSRAISTFSVRSAGSRNIATKKSRNNSRNNSDEDSDKDSDDDRAADIMFKYGGADKSSSRFNSLSSSKSKTGLFGKKNSGHALALGDSVSNGDQTPCQPLLSPTRDRSLSESNSIQPSFHSTSFRHDSRSSSTSFVRQSRLITLATIEADIRLLTEAFEGLTWKDRLMIFNLWFLVSTVGNLFGLIYSSRIIFFQDDIMASSFLKASLGMACVMYWFALIQYLEFFPRYYIMISMLKLSVPRVSQFLLGVLPIFFGYALLGMVCFGDVTDRFGNITETLRSLFAVVNGDIIYDTFDSIEFAGFGGQLYLYLYILIFTYVVLMTIIAIVEEAFFEAQEKKGLGPYEYQPGGDPNGDPNNASDNNSASPSHSGSSPTASKNTIDRESLLSAFSSGGASNQNEIYQPPESNSSGKFDENGNLIGETINPLAAMNNNAAALRRQTSLRPTSASVTADDAVVGGTSTSGKRELPENVRLLLRNVQRMPSLTGQVFNNPNTGNAQHDILNVTNQNQNNKK